MAALLVWLLLCFAFITCARGYVREIRRGERRIFEEERHEFYDDVVVRQDARLEIRPGTTLAFAPGKGLLVDIGGILIAEVSWFLH